MSTFKSVFALGLLLPLSVAAAPDIDPDNYRSLASDRRAYDVGDLLTVVVVESTTAESAAGTGAKSTTGITGTAGIGGSSGQHDHQYSANMAIAGDSSGTGQTTRRGVVKTKVAVRVTEKTGGLLRVEGEQTVTVNDEEQRVKVKGLVRPDDIAGDNTVLSTRIADAHIEISGDGAVTQAQKQNIFFRFLKWLRII